MKKILKITAAVCALSFTSCVAPTGPNTQRASIAGGLLGAAIGGVIGHQGGNALGGAAIGGALGAGAGAVVGNSYERRERYEK